MKIERNKIVFSLVLGCILLFMIVYAMMVMGGEEDQTIENNQVPVPELVDGQKEYDSKLEALDDLKEVRQTNAPSIYDEGLLDSTGVYDPDLLDKVKMQMVDSIYRDGQIRYSRKTYENLNPGTAPQIPAKVVVKDTVDAIEESETKVAAKEIDLEHQLFFASHPVKNNTLSRLNSDMMVHVRVDGTQTVKTNHRLQMRLTKEALIDNVRYPKNTLVYGFISFKPNRAVITIENINHMPIKLLAYDLQDGSEGIYVENSFREEAGQEVVGDIVDDINIVGVPQVSGIKRIFQRNNRAVRVTVTNNYELVLKLIESNFLTSNHENLYKSITSNLQ